ncbi:exodeoxyribonuclease VII small subunit [Halobacteria archaeon HArc-gm2]|nr:exodeoxyribonuclease VII small subunit [Halobacteria archaeon HArc-gm2]
MTENSIGEKTERLEHIITQIEDGEVSLERANELHEEGQQLIDELQGQLDIGDGDVQTHQ